MAEAAVNLADPAGWHARLELGFARLAGRTRLVTRRHHGPLTVQRPFQAADGTCHAYLLHPPGGVVGGDRLEIDVTADTGAHALATSPGATKFYRSAGPVATQTIDLRVADGALLEWLPQETIAFAGAHAESVTRIAITDTAMHCGWEILCLGRPSSGERFDSGEWSSRLEINRDGQPLLRERQRIAGAASLEGRAGLRDFPIVATFWATPCSTELRDAIQTLIAEDEAGPGGATLVDGLLIVRLLGDNNERVRGVLESVWRCYRESLDLPTPAAPRIWST